MDPLTKYLNLIFLVTTMAAIGLKVTFAELIAALTHTHGGLMIRSLLVNIIIAPLLGLLLVKIVPMSPDTAVGILLLAAAPGGLNAIQFTSKTDDALCYAASLLFILTLLAILFSPFIAALLLPLETPLSLPYGRVFLFLLLFLLLPLIAGLAVHRQSKRFANLLSKPVALVGTVAFVVIVLRVMAQRKEAMAALGKGEVAVMLGFIIALMIIAWLLGGPSKETRRVLATATSMRNAGLCFILAANGFPDSNVIVAVVAFSGLMIPPNMILMLYSIIRERKSVEA